MKVVDRTANPRGELTMRLNQALAAAKTTKAAANAGITAAYHALQRHPQFAGHQRTYQPYNEEGEQLPGETQLVQLNTREVFAAMRKHMGTLFDITAAIDHTNTVATADVVMDGTTILTAVPVPHLLFLEKQLADLHTMLSKTPTLEPAFAWRENADTGLRESEPALTVRTKKVKEHVVAVPPTDKHPAQVYFNEKDEPVGTWSNVRLSGAISETDKRKLLARVVQLQAAVKQAREAANATQLVEFESSPILDFVFDNNW